jgi:hypothetical protein
MGNDDKPKKQPSEPRDAAKAAAVDQVVASRSRTFRRAVESGDPAATLEAAEALGAAVAKQNELKKKR